MKINIFETSIWSYTLPDFEEYNKSIVPEIMRLFVEVDPFGRFISNHGGWQSSATDLGTQEWMQYLNKFVVTKCIDILENEIKVGYKFDLRINNNDSWININPPKTFNTIHNHLNPKNVNAFGGRETEYYSEHHHTEALFSFVYYVKTSVGMGNIIFYEKNNFMQNIRGIHPFNEIQTENGMLLIFPADIDHAVLANMTEDNRITIAGNVGFRKIYG